MNYKLMKRCKPMKTQLSLTNLLKTKEKDIFIFDRNDKGDMINNEYIRFVFSKKDINKTY